MLAMLLVAAPSCHNDVPEESKEEATTQSFRACSEFQGDATRTSLDGVNVLWSAGDALRVMNAGNLSGKSFEIESGTGTGNAVFTGQPVGAGPYVALYPWSDNFGGSLDGEVLGFTLPATQAYAAGGFGTKTNPSVAKSQTTNLSFKNLCGVVVIQLKGSCTVTGISLTALGENSYLQGPVSVNLSSPESPVLSFVTGSLTEANKTVTLDCGDGVALDPTTATPFYFVVPAGQLSAGLSVTVFDNGGGSMTRRSSAGITVERAKISTMKALTYQRTDSPFMSETTYGVYSIQSDGTLTTVRQFSSTDGDQYAALLNSSTSKRKFRIQNLDDNYAMVLTINSESLAIGESYSINSFSYGAKTLADGDYPVTLVKCAGGTLWFEDSTNGLGFIVDAFEENPNVTGASLSDLTREGDEW